jgi:membrane-associated phospholipid phosphatase
VKFITAAKRRKRKMIKTYQKAVKENMWFFSMYLFLLIIGIYPLIFIPKGDLLLWLNSYHSDSLDKIFVFFSNLGDGISFLYFILFLGLFRLKYTLLGATMFLGSGAITQIIKHSLNEPRPIAWFDQSVALNFVEGVRVHSSLSFPSGHTTAGFSIFLFIAIITKFKTAGVIFAILAAFVGFSRIYLVQHFYLDVYFGSIIGVFGSLIFYSLFEKSEKITNSKWYNYSIINNIFNLGNK